jgi:opacity protein-like surface antigen
MKVLQKRVLGLAGSAVVAAVAILGGGSVAQADRYVAPAGKAVYEAPSNWSGFYFGVHSGFVWSTTDALAPALPGSAFSVDNDSALFGGQIGLQHQFGQVVVGIEGNFSSTFKDDGDSVTCPAAIGAASCHSQLDDILSVGGRLGWAMGKWMPYATGGYASASNPQRFTATATGLPVAATSNGRHNGWYVGAGIDWMVAKEWVVGVEYRHYDFGDNDVLAFTTAGVPIGALNVDLEADTVSLRVSWKFGRPEARPLK